jgi:hypothetical protein
MIDKTTIPVGWVVQAAIPAKPGAIETDAPWRPSVMLMSAPSFEYFNVAIAAPDQTIEATTKHLAEGAKPRAGAMSVVRSPRERSLRYASGRER